mmetsp:Transcript_23799/g.32475  ORF Transcript_23799/g.32475 Transcript_23799/m.32475 type:complete len:128 (+) Transcript_23799:64-447(+)
MMFRHSRLFKRYIQLYRGVKRSHKEFQTAKQGTVLRSQPTEELKEVEGMVDTAIEHNLGSHHPSLSSWTRSPSVAKLFSGSDGVVLSADLGPPKHRLFWSPDNYYEEEVLVEGPISGAIVLDPNKLN